MVPVRWLDKLFFWHLRILTFSNVLGKRIFQEKLRLNGICWSLKWVFFIVKPVVTIFWKCIKSEFPSYLVALCFRLIKMLQASVLAWYAQCEMGCYNMEKARKDEVTFKRSSSGCRRSRMEGVIHYIMS